MAGSADPVGGHRGGQAPVAAYAAGQPLDPQVSDRFACSVNRVKFAFFKTVVVYAKNFEQNLSSQKLNFL